MSAFAHLHVDASCQSLEELASGERSENVIWRIELKEEAE
jgi:hypothetical protein